MSACRKAYRLGKWLANANAIRKMPLSTRYSYLEWLANGGEGVYYFVEQLTWYVNLAADTRKLARHSIEISHQLYFVCSGLAEALSRFSEILRVGTYIGQTYRQGPCAWPSSKMIRAGRLDQT